ncbi:uncharacterized protein METZ01_LOCUS502445, partial [marine metagenome]
MKRKKGQVFKTGPLLFKEPGYFTLTQNL